MTVFEVVPYGTIDISLLPFPLLSPTFPLTPSHSPPLSPTLSVNPTIRTEGELMQVLNELESVMFSCVATGNPSPSFTWTRNGQFLPVQ